MTAALLLAVLAAAPLPEGTARWRLELGGEVVGTVQLSIRCEGPDCRVAWDSLQRLPAEAGGGLASRRVDLQVDRAGRALGPAEVVEGGRRRQVDLPRGATPGLLLELALQAATSERGETCLEAVDETTGTSYRACARLEGSELVIATRGEREVVVGRRGAFPTEVRLDGQRARFVLDSEAAPPASPPRLFGVQVAGPTEPRQARAFCGRPLDPPPPADGAGGLPEPSAPGASCRDRTAAWLERARAAGLRGRTAVGIAWDGSAWVWHAWAEVAVGPGWLPVDPSFQQRPARGPRFTLAVWADGDEAARQEAGHRILACWGRAAVERQAAGSPERGTVPGP